MSCALKELISVQQIPTRSVENIKEVGKLMGLCQSKVEDLILPQDVHVFRLHVSILGAPLSVWGCTAFHNKALGAYKGGIRIAADVNFAEVVELARLMTLKTALTELEFGGAKTGVAFDMREAYRLAGKEGYDPEFETYVKREIMKEYAHKYRGMLARKRYIPAPDIATGPSEMVAIFNETHEPSSVTGKPEGIQGWLPGRSEATGYGVYLVCKRLMQQLGKKPQDVRVAVQGFGNVGSNAARFLAADGARIVAASDVQGAVHAPDGLDVDAVAGHIRTHGTLVGSAAPIDDIFSVPRDFFIPAAVNDSLGLPEAKRLRADCVVEGANFPTTYAAMQYLQAKGVLVVPDIIANSGGVIASQVEFLNVTATRKIKKNEVFAIIEEKLMSNFDLAMKTAEERGLSLDLSCTLIAVKRVFETMRKQGWI